MFIKTASGNALNMSQYRKLVILTPDYALGKSQVWAVLASFKAPTSRTQPVNGEHVQTFDNKELAQAFIDGFIAHSGGFAG